MSEKKIQAWYSIDLEKAKSLYQMDTKQIRERMQQDLDARVPLRMSIFDYLCNNSAAFGPFASKKHALAMSSTSLDEQDKDLFGNEWDFVTFSVKENLIVSPNYKNLVKQYICVDPDCRSIQSFRGCCQKCRYDDTKDDFVKTVEYRVWDSE